MICTTWHEAGPLIEAVRRQWERWEVMGLLISFSTWTQDCRKFAVGDLPLILQYVFFSLVLLFSLPSRRRGILYYSMNNPYTTSDLMKMTIMMLSLHLIFIFCIFCGGHSLKVTPGPFWNSACRVCMWPVCVLAVLWLRVSQGLEVESGWLQLWTILFGRSCLWFFFLLYFS